MTYRRIMLGQFSTEIHFNHSNVLTFMDVHSDNQVQTLIFKKDIGTKLF
jgi:hypothetical protein